MPPTNGVMSVSERLERLETRQERVEQALGKVQIAVSVLWWKVGALSACIGGVLGVTATFVMHRMLSDMAQN